MAEMALSQVQKTAQVQVQRLSQKQIQILRFLSMNSQDLRNEILREAEENPALEIVSDSFAEGTAALRRRNDYSSVRTGVAGAAGMQAAEDFQNMLESSPAPAETLQEFLVHQLNMSGFSAAETELCQRLIENLDSSGFYILAPESLLDAQNPLHTEAFLEHCIALVRGFEPAGICCRNITESLELQARLREDCPSLARLILHGHLDFITPPHAEKSRRKILDFLEEQKNLAFRSGDDVQIERRQVTLEAVEAAIHFIQTLNPHPTAEFRPSSAAYVRPDVYVTRVQGILEKEDLQNGFVLDTETSYFRVVPANDTIPVVQVAPDFKRFSDGANGGRAGTVAGEGVPAVEDAASREQSRFVRIQLKAAESFLDALSYRTQAVIAACSRIVHIQKEFFRKGPGHLAPLTQKQFAQMLEVHPSSVSRIADSKFIHCDWGTFPLKYFFSNAVPKAPDDSNAAAQNATEVSTDAVRAEIEKILAAQKPGDKKLSDQKLADMLQLRGYKIARRTVAKYRAKMNISSSYDR